MKPTLIGSWLTLLLLLSLAGNDPIRLVSVSSSVAEEETPADRRAQEEIRMAGLKRLNPFRPEPARETSPALTSAFSDSELSSLLDLRPIHPILRI
jgi:hypothetical protein